MAIRRRLRATAERLTGVHRFGVLPRGISLYVDVRRSLPTYDADVIFDVGANIGQTASEYLGWFPRSGLYCFEPVASTFATLERRMRRTTNVQCFNLAMGAARGRGAVSTSGIPATHSMLSGDRDMAMADPAAMEMVEVDTVAGFCEDHRIERLNLLKIDTEGHDLAVLAGAAPMLERQAVDLIQVEAGMNPRNRWHVPFEQIKAYLEGHGYLLFAIYEQVPERVAGQPQMRRSNPVFVSEAVVSRNSRRMNVP